MRLAAAPTTAEAEAAQEEREDEHDEENGEHGDWPFQSVPMTYPDWLPASHVEPAYGTEHLAWIGGELKGSQVMRAASRQRSSVRRPSANAATRSRRTAIASVGEGR